MAYKKLSFAELLYNYGLYIIFFSMIAVFTISKPSFLSLGNINNILQQSSAWAVAATGLVFVMLTAGIDISIGSNMYFTAYIAVLLMHKQIIPDTMFGMALLVTVALMFGGLLGFVNGFFVAFAKVPPLIVSIATFSLFRGTAYTINQVKSVKFDNNIGDLLGRGKLFGTIPVVVIAMVCVIFTGQFILNNTKFGRHIYAIGNNEAAARQVGIPVDRTKFLAYVICGACAGLCGLLIGAQTNAVVANFAAEHHFIIISCAVLGGVSLFGGKGTIFPGAFLGIIIVVCIENGLVFLGADPYFYTIVRGFVIFFAVTIDCLKNKNELR